MSWSCSSCTLENQDSSLSCRVCDTNRVSASSFLMMPDLVQNDEQQESTRDHQQEVISVVPETLIRVWNCQECTFENTNEEELCEMCYASRASQERAMLIDSTRNSDSNQREAQMNPYLTNWICNHCTFENQDISSLCSMCGSVRANVSSPLAASEHAQEEHDSPQEHLQVEAMLEVHEISSGWSCQECTFLNDINEAPQVCNICGVNRVTIALPVATELPVTSQPKRSVFFNIR